MEAALWDGTAFFVGVVLGYLFCRWWPLLFLAWIVATVVALMVISPLTSACKSGDEVCVLVGLAILVVAASALVGLLCGIVGQRLVWRRHRGGTP